MSMTTTWTMTSRFLTSPRLRLRSHQNHLSAKLCNTMDHNVTMTVVYNLDLKIWVESM